MALDIRAAIGIGIFFRDIVVGKTMRHGDFSFQQQAENIVVQIVVHRLVEGIAVSGANAFQSTVVRIVVQRRGAPFIHKMPVKSPLPGQIFIG